MGAILDGFTIWSVIALTLLMTLDVFTGYAHAVITNTVQSARMRQGFWKKGSELAYICVAGALDIATKYLLRGTELDETIATAIIPLTVAGASAYLLVMEITSITENMRAIFGYNPTEE